MIDAIFVGGTRFGGGDSVGHCCGSRCGIRRVVVVQNLLLLAWWWMVGLLLQM